MAAVPFRVQAGMRIRGVTGVTAVRKIAGLALSAALLLPAAAAAEDVREAEHWTEREFAVMAEIGRAPSYADYRDARRDWPAAGEAAVIRNGEPLFIPEGGSAELEVRVPERGRYRLQMEYLPSERSSAAVELTLRVDGEFPFREAAGIPLYRKWIDDPSSRKTDGRGNDVRPPQIEAREWLRADLSSHTGEVFEFALDEGVHTLTVGSPFQELHIREIALTPIPDIPSYEEYLRRHAGKADAAGGVRIQGERAAYKNDPVIVPLEDRSTPATEPNRAPKISLNKIGGDRWSRPGQEIVWTFRAPESGFYEIRIKARQHYAKGFYSIRRLKLDGEVPFREAEQIAFPYGSRWKFVVPGAADGKPFKFYLEEGEHTLSLTAVSGEFGDVFGQVRESIGELNEIYRKLLMVLGATPDTLRDYHIPEILPDVMASIGEQREILDELYRRLLTREGFSRGELEPLRRTAEVLDEFVRHPYDIAARFIAFKNDIAALSNWLAEASASPLDIDYIDIAPPGSPLPEADASWWELILFNLRMFVASFTENFDVIERHAEDERPVTVWVMTGREQAQVLNELIQSAYTPATGRKVNLQLVSQESLLASVAAKNTADVVLGVSGEIPVDYALRGALVDLSQFPDAGEVLARFHESALVPLRFQGGVYGLPETMSYPMMFYRKDILAELGLAPPGTWNEVLAALPALQKNNLEILIETGLQTGSDAMGAFLMFLYQHGGELYRDGGMAVGIDSAEGMEAFKFWTDLYRNYGLPVNFNTANRFRTGEAPLVISDFSLYNMLSVMAPEIKGLWGMLPVPGTVREDGSVDRSVGASGLAAVMFRTAKEKEAAWEFMKWWTSAETQIEFARRIESILGASARYPTANLDAMGQMQWSGEEWSRLQEQLRWVKGVPQVPGGYLVPRNINNAFRKVAVSKSQGAREALLMYTRIINNELTQKRKEFGLPTAEDGFASREGGGRFE